MQMGCILSLKVQPCRLMRGRSPHIRHLFAASFRFLAASHTTRLPLEYHSVTIRLPLSTSRQGDRVIKTEKGAFQVTLRAPSNSFYVHYPEWYSGNPKRSAPPLVVYPAALPKFITCQLSYTSSASDRSSECEIRTVNCHLSTINCQLSIVNCQLSIVTCPSGLVQRGHRKRSWRFGVHFGGGSPSFRSWSCPLH